MPTELEAPHLSYLEIAKRAAGFLNRYHPSGKIPVPMEEIIDLHWKIDIIPTPSLRSAFEVDAFLSCDMTSIYVDEDIYDRVPTRLRFSLAHEVAHAVLHQKTYHSFGCGGSIEDWKRIQRSLPDEAYEWMEYHANAFAGLVLVPPASLRAEYEAVLREIRSRGSTLPRSTDAAKEYLSRVIARRFEVSPQVLARRMDKDALWSIDCPAAMIPSVRS